MVKDHFGVLDVAVRINSRKEYIYALGSEHEFEVFLEKMTHSPGVALAYIKRVAIRCDLVPF
jgi:hypothetical protein